jgi:hypothetical protein
VPRRGEESWIGLMREVRLLRQAPMFAQSHKDIVLSDCGSRATCGKQNDFDWCTAASEQVMRAGCHSAQFTLLSGSCAFGVIRPCYKVDDGHGAPWIEEHCFYDTTDGECLPGRQDWVGMQSATPGDRVSMLLDLDKGSMAIYKNGKWLGVMVGSGLGGEYCWAVDLSDDHSSARIGPTR